MRQEIEFSPLMECGEIDRTLKQVNKSNPDIFPFEIIRAQDYNIFPDPQFRMAFRDNLGYTYLNPRYVFCLIIVNDVILSGKRIIFQSKK